jgi:amino acid transporter
MSLLLAGLLVAAVMVVAITAMLAVRRRAPAGSYFEDGDRAAGVFGVLATGFAVLLGFVVFLAFESFDTSRSGAEREAQVVREQFETAQLFPVAVRARLSGELVCYARTVIHKEWPEMEAGTLADSANPWTLAMFGITKKVEPRSASEQAAYGKWLDQRTDREDARADRAHGAEGVIPLQLWIVLFVSAVAIFVFMLFFADSAERAVVQATMMGGVAMVIASTLVLLWFLDHPYHSGPGGLRPVAMERTIRILEQDAAVFNAKLAIPCNGRGVSNGA